MIILEINNLTHIFSNGNKALDQVNLTIKKGEFLILAGANGSGKTVLVRHFNGLLLPTEGEVLLEGEPISKDLTNARKKVGLIFQNSDNQIVGQTVADDIAFGPENLGLAQGEVTDRVKYSLKAVGLEDVADERPQILSGGQKRKLAVAGVLAMKPKIIIFDEPFTGLDYPGVIQVLTQINYLHGKGHTIIVVTHELEKILAHADRLVIMEKGRIVENGTPEELMGRLELYGIKKPYGNNRKVETMTWLN